MQLQSKIHPLQPNKPSVSVVIPAYNAARFLSATVASVQAQTLAEWEMWIVDDGSTDATAALAQSFAESDPRIRVQRQANTGQSEARNAGYAVTDPAAKYIAFLDADDVWEPNTLQTLAQTLDLAPWASAAYGVAHYIDEAGAAIRPGELERHQRERYGLEGERLIAWPLDRPTTFAVEAVTERIITPGTALIRRSVLERVGLFDPAIRFWEDWDLWLRICRRGEIAFVDRRVLGYRRHEANVSNDDTALDSGLEEVRRNLIASVRDEPELHRMALLGKRYHRREVSRQRLGWATQSLAQGRMVDALKHIRHAALLYTATRKSA